MKNLKIKSGLVGLFTLVGTMIGGHNEVKAANNVSCVISAVMSVCHVVPGGRQVITSKGDLLDVSPDGRVSSAKYHIRGVIFEWPGKDAWFELYGRKYSKTPPYKEVPYKEQPDRLVVLPNNSSPNTESAATDKGHPIRDAIVNGATAGVTVHVLRKLFR